MDSPARRHRDAEGRAGAGPRQDGRRRGDDRAPEAGDRQAEAPDLRAALGAHGAPPRPDGAGARGAGSDRHRGRDRRRAGRGQDDERSPPSRASARPASRSPRICRASASSCRRPTACDVLRRHAPEQARRDRHRDAGGDPAPVEGDPARAREDDVPGLREDQRAAGAVPRHAARLGRPEPAGHAAVREVRAAPAAEPSGRALRPRRRAAQPVDARRSGRRRLRRAGAAAPAHRAPCLRRRAAARRRHDGAGARQGQDRHRTLLDLRAR